MEIRYEPDFFSCDPTRLFSAFSAPLREAVFLRFHSLLPVALSPTVCFHAAPPSRRGGAPYLQHVTEYQAAGSLRALLPKNILCGEVAPLRESLFSASLPATRRMWHLSLRERRKTGLTHYSCVH